MNVVATYTPSGGGLAEQYSRSTGAPLSAVDLTWSYASALTAFEARNNTGFASWGAKGLTTTCSGGSGGSSGSTVAVTFNVDATTVYGGKSHLLFRNARAHTCLLTCREYLPHWFGRGLARLVYDHRTPPLKPQLS